MHVFFDGVLFALMGLTGLLTALVVYYETRRARLPFDREKVAIILRSSAFAALFSWASLRFFFHLEDRESITWTLRLTTLFAMVNYLYVLTDSFIRRHGFKFWRNNGANL